MRNYFKVLIFTILTISSTIRINAQITSTLSVFSPSTSTLDGDASRYGYHSGNWSTFYMRYNDCPYFCGMYYPTIWGWAPVSTRIPMPNSFFINDFKKFVVCQGFVGSYMGVGMYGWTNHYTSTNSNNLIATYLLPTIERLKRIAVGSPIDEMDATKAFSIGEKAVSSKAPPRSFLLEFYAEGGPSSLSYYYAPLPYDNMTGENESAEDVVIVDNYVIFATKDTRPGHSLINLRISDTINVLSTNNSIDFQWEFLMPPYEKAISDLRLLPLGNGDFVLAYTKFNSREELYHLCFHVIILADLIAGNNTIVSHEIKIQRDCSNLVDVIFNPDVSTIVFLLNGGGRSELYHTKPYSNTSIGASKLDYPAGHLTSIDTIADYYSCNTNIYVAMGGDEFFSQDISNGYDIEWSCLGMTKMVFELVEPPLIEIIRDPLERYFGNMSISPIYETADYFNGARTCGVVQAE